MIQDWIQSYHPSNDEELKHALREIVQETTLCGLYRGDFFEKAAFYGGTALRIFYKLPRFSEDLDFSLLSPDPTFSLDPYINSIVDECEAIGLQVTVNRKNKTTQSSIDSAFLKTETSWDELIVNLPKSNASISLKIKIEIDTKPPLGFITEEKLLLKPISCYIKSFSLPDLFAGKMHALLYRKWKTRIKGRDWYDMEWYIKKGVPIHLSHFETRALQSGDISASITNEELLELLKIKITTTSIDRVKEDVVRFIANPSELDIWSNDYFMDLLEHLKFA